MLTFWSDYFRLYCTKRIFFLYYIVHLISPTIFLVFLLSFLCVFSFIYETFYLMLYHKGHYLYQPWRADYVRGTVCFARISSKVQVASDSCKERFRAGCDKGISSGKTIWWVWMSGLPEGGLHWELCSSYKLNTWRSARLKLSKFGRFSKPLRPFISMRWTMTKFWSSFSSLLQFKLFFRSDHQCAGFAFSD